MEHAIVIQDVTKRFRETVAVSHVTASRANAPVGNSSNTKTRARRMERMRNAYRCFIVFPSFFI